MSHILALDSATDACSVALYRSGEITSLFELAAKSHTQRLLPMVDDLLKSAGCTLNDLDAIAFGRGPGSFTGLRICLGIVQGLAFGANLPVVPVSTLAAIASGHLRECAQKSAASLPCLVALDARMDEVYWALFEADDQLFEPKMLTVESVSTPSLVARDATVLALHQEFAALGSGWNYGDLAALNPSQLITGVHPHAEDIVRIAAEKFARGEVLSVMDAQPVYLRDTVSWQKRQRIRTAP